MTTNSALVSYTRLSPNHSWLRNHKIDTITPHCVVGHLSLQTLGNVFAPTSRKASSNYGIDDNGNVGMYVEEKNRSWCTSSASNDHRAVTIEIASDLSHPYKIKDKALDGLIRLSADICIRNKIPKLLWENNKNLIGQVDKQNITIHRWFSNTICPGDYIVGQLGEVAIEVNKILGIPNQIIPKFQPYLVKIDTDTLNYRTGPGTNHQVAGSVKRGQVFTIIEEGFAPNGARWGKLKSGAGWISLAYTMKVS